MFAHCITRLEPEGSGGAFRRQPVSRERPSTQQVGEIKPGYADYTGCKSGEERGVGFGVSLANPEDPCVEPNPKLPL